MLFNRHNTENLLFFVLALWICILVFVRGVVNNKKMLTQLVNQITKQNIRWSSGLDVEEKERDES